MRQLPWRWFLRNSRSVMWPNSSLKRTTTCRNACKGNLRSCARPSGRAGGVGSARTVMQQKGKVSS